MALSHRVSAKDIATQENYAYFSGIMKLSAASWVLVLFWTAVQGQSSAPKAVTANTYPELRATDCAEDGFYAFIPEAPLKMRIARIRDIDLEAVFGPHDGDGATFWFVRGGKTI